MAKKYNRVTFEELASDFSHYEVAFLSFCKASDILLSATSLLSNSAYKPKVAMVAYDQICSDIQATKDYKQQLMHKFNYRYEESVDEDYVVDEEELV